VLLWCLREQPAGRGARVAACCAAMSTSIAGQAHHMTSQPIQLIPAIPALVQSAPSCQMRREIREAELAAARDNEPNPEELEKYIKERFGNRRCGLALDSYPTHRAALGSAKLHCCAARCGFLPSVFVRPKLPQGVQLDASVPGCLSPEWSLCCAHPNLLQLRIVWV